MCKLTGKKKRKTPPPPYKDREMGEIRQGNSRHKL